MKADRRIRSRKRNRRRNKGLGGLLCAVIVSAGLCLAAPPVTAAGAEAGPAETAFSAARQEMRLAAGTAILQTETMETVTEQTLTGKSGADEIPASEAQEGTGQQNGSGAGATATGTVILLGAGAYTAVRKQWNEKKDAKPKEYVYFENHTKNGTLRDEEKYID